MRSSQVNQGENNVEAGPSQVDQSASQVEDYQGQGVENAGGPSHARRRGTACLPKLRRSEVAWLGAQRSVCPLVILFALA